MINNDCFIAGEYVYWPEVDDKLHKLKHHPDDTLLTICNGNEEYEIFARDGTIYDYTGVLEGARKVIFKANEANKKALQQLYQMEFAEQTEHCYISEVIKAIDSGTRYVPCVWSHDLDSCLEQLVLVDQNVTLITRYIKNIDLSGKVSYTFYDKHTNSYEFVIKINLDSGRCK